MKTTFHRTLMLLVTVVVLLSGVGSAQAVTINGGVLAEGMLFNQPEKFIRKTKAASQTLCEKAPVAFFRTLEPETSKLGSVKSYVVKATKKFKAKDWQIVKKSNQESLEQEKKCLLRPVYGRVSSLFGRRRHPKTKSWHFHAGIDIVAKKGTPILASMAGKVTFAGWKRGYGMVIILEHNDGFETVYAHCSRMLVKKGQIVDLGQRIAKIGSTGVATGSHLHFEVRRQGNVRNPFRYLLD
jgi:murein DD-endopeptidase MepM/ murein hydrolase activator NlpD